MTFSFRLQTASWRFHVLAVLLAAFNLGLAMPAFASPGAPDPTFKLGGRGPDSKRGKGVFPLQGGRLLVTGDFKTWNGQDRPGAVLLEKNGALVESFLPSKQVADDLGSPFLYQVVSLSTQRALVLIGYENATQVRLLNMDGSLDIPTVPQPTNFSVVVLVQVSDGSFYGVGVNVDEDGSATSPIMLMIHFNKNADYDTAYGLKAMALGIGRGDWFGPYLAQEPGGTLLFAHSAIYLTDDKTLGALVRLRLDGTVDPSSKKLAFTRSRFGGVKVLANGSIFIDSFVSPRRGDKTLPKVIRLKSNGQVDTTFRSDAFANLTKYGNGFGFMPSAGGQANWVLASVPVKIIHARKDPRAAILNHLKIIKVNAKGELDQGFTPLDVETLKQNPILIMDDKTYYASGNFPAHGGKPAATFGRFLLK